MRMGVRTKSSTLRGRALTSRRVDKIVALRAVWTSTPRGLPERPAKRGPFATHLTGLDPLLVTGTPAEQPTPTRGIGPELSAY